MGITSGESWSIAVPCSGKASPEPSRPILLLILLSFRLSSRVSSSFHGGHNCFSPYRRGFCRRIRPFRHPQDATHLLLTCPYKVDGNASCVPSWGDAERMPQGSPRWARRRKKIGLTGIEPAHLAVLDPKSSASASSATAPRTPQSGRFRFGRATSARFEGN